MDQPTMFILFFSLILIMGGVLFALIALSKRNGSRIDVDKFRCRWLEIEGRLSRDNETSYSLCILNADSLLDKALRDKGIAGKTMADRMKAMQGKWTNGNGVWAAHKLRNRIAHEPETVKLDYERARQALVVYKQALKDIGAI